MWPAVAPRTRVLVSFHVGQLGCRLLQLLLQLLLVEALRWRLRRRGLKPAVVPWTRVLAGSHVGQLGCRLLRPQLLLV